MERKLRHARTQNDCLAVLCVGRDTRRYSSNPIVDAVLEDKAARCTDLEIGLTTQLFLPSLLDFDPAALCSVFSNLLDNAIHACEHCPPPERFISCGALVQGGYLIVEVVNSKIHAPDNIRTDKFAGHGLGLLILNYIAATYDGTFAHSSDQTTFTATIWLKLQP